ncbi:hypothetical protein LAZ67_9003038 [Cordylochernes scorpioides]|uniref:Reverse transcriptase domain-containing protein n=1 Tax=Cordylochernes scorpioides TaxID=51811 RepID=A0ABY6KU74_9ARAC|nr:hypothetical protein LAZ67_9003038 [Cordylochernes scorpioides]
MSRLHGLRLYTPSFTVPHKKKSSGVRSGERAGSKFVGPVDRTQGANRVSSTLSRPYTTGFLLVGHSKRWGVQTKEILITRSDKGGQTVILETAEYINKMNNILADRNTFELISETDKVAICNQYKKDLRSLQRNNTITADELKDFLSNINSDAYIYGLPKLHKPAAPLAKFIANLLIPLLKDNPPKTTITSTPKFISEISGTPYRPNHSMVSFDVVNLYPSLPHQLVMECTKNFLSDHNITSNIYTKIIKLIDICLHINIFSFNSNYYKQTKGSPMGSPLSSPLAEIVMQQIDRQITGHFPTEIQIWSRYIDDIFCLCHTETIDSILTKLKDFHKEIDFTPEKETNGTLPFLDIFITRQSQKFNTTVVGESKLKEWPVLWVWLYMKDLPSLLLIHLPCSIILMATDLPVSPM